MDLVLVCFVTSSWQRMFRTNAHRLITSAFNGNLAQKRTFSYCPHKVVHAQYDIRSARWTPRQDARRSPVVASRQRQQTFSTSDANRTIGHQPSMSCALHSRSSLTRSVRPGACCTAIEEILYHYHSHEKISASSVSSAYRHDKGVLRKPNITDEMATRPPF